MIYLFKIEEDGHFHGGPPPKPWVAEITGTDPRFGLARSFVQPFRDYREARAAWSGNVYGVVARFPMHEGRLYEVSLLRGKPSKRYVAREFYVVERGQPVERTADEALGIAAKDEGAAGVLTIPELPDDPPVVAELTLLEESRRLGFVLVGQDRRYRLRNGLVHRVRHVDAKGREQVQLMGSEGGVVRALSIEEARSWLLR